MILQVLFVVLNTCFFIGAENSAGLSRIDGENLDILKTAMLVSEIISWRNMSFTVFNQIKFMGTNGILSF